MKNLPVVVRTREEIDEMYQRVIDWLDVIEDKDVEGIHSEMPFEYGVLLAMEWLLNEEGEEPISEENAVENFFDIEDDESEEEND